MRHTHNCHGFADTKSIQFMKRKIFCGILCLEIFNSEDEGESHESFYESLLKSSFLSF